MHRLQILQPEIYNKYFLSELIAYLKNNRRYSSHTLVAYEKDLIQFFTFLNQYNYPDLQQLQLIHFRLWMSDLHNNGLSPVTINRKFSSIKTWLNFLLRNDWIATNPASKLTLPKKPKKLVNDIPVIDLLNMFQRFPWQEEENGTRDKAILSLFYTSGLRLSELLQLKKSDIDFSRKEIRVLGKRNKIRMIPIPDFLIVELQLLTNSHSGSHVFVLPNNQPLYPVLVWRLVIKYLSKFSSASKIHPHVLRHSFATHLLNNGANLIAIKELMGHTSLAATQVYTKNSFEKLKNIHQKLHPRK